MTLKLLGQEPESDYNINIGPLQLAFARYAEANTPTMAGLRVASVLVPGTTTVELTKNLYDFEAGHPMTIKASVLRELMAGFQAQFAQPNRDTLQYANGGSIMQMDDPGYRTVVVADAGNTDQTFKVFGLPALMAVGDRVSYYDVSATAWLNTTISAINTGTGFVTLTDVIPGGAAVAADVLIQGTSQNISAIAVDAWTLDGGGSLLADGDNFLAMDQSNVKTLQAGSTARSLVLSSAAGVAAGYYLLCWDKSTGGLSLQYVDSMAGTTANILPGLPADPEAAVDTATLVSFVRATTVVGNVATVDRPRDFVEVADDVLIKLDSMALMGGGDELPEYSTRIRHTSADNLQQIDCWFKRHINEVADQLVVKGEPRRVAVKGVAKTWTESFSGETVLMIAKIIFRFGPAVQTI